MIQPDPDYVAGGVLISGPDAGIWAPWAPQATAVVALNNYSFGEALRQEQVVTDAHQRPFAVHLFQAPQQEPP